MSGLYDDDYTAAPVAAPVAAPNSRGLYSDDEVAPVASGQMMEPIGLVSDEAKAAAKAAALKAKEATKARAKQAGAAAGVAAAGLKAKLTDLRGQSIGRACKQVCAGIAVVTVLACSGLEWRAHRSVAAPVEPTAAAQAVIAKVAPPVVVPVTPPAAVASSPAPVAVAPVHVRPAVKADPLAPKSFNPMNPNYRGPGQAVAAAPVQAAPVAAPVSKPAKATTGPKSFNPMSPNYKPVKAPVKSDWEASKDAQLDAYFHKTAKGG